MSIWSVSTFSMEEATCALRDGFSAGHPYARSPRAWVGFEVSCDGPSPLRMLKDGPSLIVAVHDSGHDCFDYDRAMANNPPWPSLSGAKDIESFVSGLLESDERYALCVHCHAGIWRSGAVAQWMVDSGIPEDAGSRRRQTKAPSLPFNRTIYELLWLAGDVEQVPGTNSSTSGQP